MSYIYLVNYWVPFPASEYGGVITVIANSDEQAIEQLKLHKFSDGDYNDLIAEQVGKARRYALADNYQPRVVNEFWT